LKEKFVYEIVGETILFVMVLALFLRDTRRGGRDSATHHHSVTSNPAAVYLIGYALLRFVVEVFRGDPERGFLWKAHTPGLSHLLGLPTDTPVFLSVSQGISLAVLLLTVSLILWARHRTAWRG